MMLLIESRKYLCGKSYQFGEPMLHAKKFLTLTKSSIIIGVQLTSGPLLLLLFSMENSILTMTEIGSTDSMSRKQKVYSI